MKKLEIGSGNNPTPGYDHLDIDPNLPHLEFCCSMDKLPIEDNVYNEILSIHSIEHIGWRKGVTTLKEWYRVLAPGGKVSIATPNLKWIAKCYLENKPSGWYKDFESMHVDEKKHLKINGFHSHVLWANFKIFSSGEGGDEHMACYDSDLLREVMKAAGFTSVKVMYDAESLIMEGYK